MPKIPTRNKKNAYEEKINSVQRIKPIILDTDNIKDLKKFKKLWKKHNQQERQKRSEGSRPDRMEPVVPGRGGFLRKVWILLASLIKSNGGKNVSRNN